MYPDTIQFSTVQQKIRPYTGVYPTFARLGLSPVRKLKEYSTRSQGHLLVGRDTEDQPWIAYLRTILRSTLLRSLLSV